jgi:hypothetical protein
LTVANVILTSFETYTISVQRSELAVD